MCRHPYTASKDDFGSSQIGVIIGASLYVMSGVTQPLLMTLCKQAGLADPKAQLYMFFYYLGPSLLIFTLCGQWAIPTSSSRMVVKAGVISIFDVCAQALNYTGASLAGATIFAVIYSSVTIWTAVFSRIFLHRSLSFGQWVAVTVVFFGLAVTATDSAGLGPDVARGTTIILAGSCMHGGTYVMSEAVMRGEGQLAARQNSAIQGVVACFFLGLWQLCYTLPRFHDTIGEPMHAADTTIALAATILIAFAAASLLHSFTFFHTLKYFPGGATSAGVFKGLQAVLVFVAAHFIYCGRVGGEEMCFSTAKLFSLVTVVAGVVLFSLMAEEVERHGTRGSKEGYAKVESCGAETSV